MQLSLLGIENRQIDRAVEDIWTGLSAWRLWSLFGYNDVKMRYRRSTLGPFWAVISAGIQILVTGLVMGFLFHNDLHRYLPFISIGLIIWNTLTAMISDGAQAFIGSSDVILQVKRPLFVYLLQVIWRNLIIATHSMTIFFIVAFLFGLFPGPIYFLVIPGCALFLINLIWMAGIAAILSTRFRDIPMIVTNMLTALFWLTPVIYQANQLSGRIKRVILFNPLYHVIEVFRAPLLLHMPTATDWLAATGFAVFGWLAFILLFARTRSRIPYWL